MIEPGKEMEGLKEQARLEREDIRNRPVYVPRVDIFETMESITLLADMPGVDEQSVDIIIEKDVLTINGTVEPESHTDFRLVHADYGTGDYRRSFTVTDEIDHNRIEAVVKNGVLKLVLPKAERAKPKKITVKTA
ncbi:MAG: Hsp20/alpha crystallin family protein [Syntrophales bacterium]|jgi:HSP20 family molecular chaperone IbpA|nr:Hsp20/alpha crystallin family protein [Syntrophales bacterium]MCK9527380.1 Hsp20/alpha crystallin family protein [Syntrophales bacterium]MDX9921482.1 Hsp20/alpha crystallin family protein [Syntrophales bacterium]